MTRRHVLLICAILALVAVAYAGWHMLTKSRLLRTHIAEGTTATESVVRRVPVEDWPQWRGPRGDGISRETSLAEQWPKDGPARVWSADVGVGYSSPIAAGGRVYLFSLDNKREALTAFDAATGHILWNDEAGNGWIDSYAGTRATPTIDGDAIYTFGGVGDLIRRELSTGHVVWQLNVLDTIGAKPISWGSTSSPVVAGNLIFVQRGKSGPVAVAVDKQTGKMIWQSEATGEAGYAQPVLADVAGAPQLVVFAGDAVWAMDPASGRTLWHEPWKTGYGVNSCTPVYSDGRLILTSAYGMGSVMLAVSPDGAHRLWENKKAGSKFQGTVLDNGSLYLNSEGRLMCLNWADGVTKWQRADLGLGDHGSFVRVADKLLCLSTTGELILLRAGPDGVAELARAQAITGERIWSTPLLYGGRVYVKGIKELVCFDVAETGPTTRPTTGPTEAR